MYNTIKELHIEIEQRISEITSNRHRSIAPEWIDMVLNRCAIKYIESIVSRKTNYKREGFEDTIKRADDLKSLKRTTGWEEVVIDDENLYGHVLLPGDYLHLISSDSKIIYSKNINDFKHTSKIIISGCIVDFSKFDYSTASDWTKGVVTVNVGRDSEYSFDITDLIPLLVTDEDNEADLFEFITLFIDRLRDYKNNVYWEYFNEQYTNKGIYCFTNDQNPEIKVEFTTSSGTDSFGITCDTSLSVGGDRFMVEDTNYIRGNDVIPSEDISTTLTNYYLNKNRHLNPITELLPDRLNVYYGNNHIVKAVNINYIKKPKPFSSFINQMSDLTITPGFMDLVVSEMLLILKDNSYNVVKQQSNIE